MDKATELVRALARAGKTLATAESCTGGFLGKQITGVSGSAALYPRGVISCCNRVKHEILGVSQADLDAYGAVSEPVARQMAEGVRRVIGADVGVGITGIAGPKSDDTNKPVGLVYIGVSDGCATRVERCRFDGDRDQVRRQSCQRAMELILELLG